MIFFWCLFSALCICLRCEVVNNSFGYPLCQGLSYRFDGYTYIHVPGEDVRLWNHCSFPNPFVDHVLCGRPKIEGRHFLCDPDRLVKSEISSVNIDTHLRDLQRRTSTVCVRSNGESESFIVAVAIIDKILVPDLQSPHLCSNDCGRLEPYLDLTERYPSNTEQDEIMKNFADNLRLEWSLGSCDNDVIILYCKEFNKVHVSSGSKASYYLTRSIATELQDTFINYINDEGFQKGLEKGLLHMIDSLKVSLRGFTLGHVIMVAHVSTMLCFGVGLYLYLFVRKDDVSVRDDKYPWALSDWLIQFVTGTWLVKKVVLVIAMMSHHEKGKGLMCALGAAFLGLFICLVLYIASTVYF